MKRVAESNLRYQCLLQRVQVWLLLPLLIHLKNHREHDQCPMDF